MFIDLAVIASVVAISVPLIGFMIQAMQKTLQAVLTLERDLSRMNSNIQKLAIRLSNVERFLEKRDDFIGAALETGLTEDRF